MAFDEEAIWRQPLDFRHAAIDFEDAMAAAAVEVMMVATA